MSYSPPSVEFKDRLKRRMDELRIDSSALAKKTGLSVRSIYNYLSGKARPMPFSLNKICEALEVDRDYFLKNEPVIIDISDKLPSVPAVPSSLETIAQEITAVFERHNLSFRDVFEILNILKKKTMKQAIEATKDMPYQGGGL